MRIQDLFIESNLALLSSIKQIKENQWSIDLPNRMTRIPMNIKQAVQYHTYDDAWVPDMLDGKTIDEVGSTYDHLLSDPNIISSYEKYNTLASEAVAAFNDLDKVMHLSYGDYPASEYLLHVVSFRAFRSYDIAKLIGTDTKMDSDLVEALTEHFSPVIEDYRQMGVFRPALIVSVDATPQEKLLALVGRD